MKTSIKSGICVVLVLLVETFFGCREQSSIAAVVENEQADIQMSEPVSQVEQPVQIGLLFPWGDGRVHKIGAAEYNRCLIDYTQENPVYKGEGPCVVDFYATWCGPCMVLAPMLEDLAKKYKGKVQFYKIDVDDNRSLAASYGIRAIPTLFFFKNNKMQRYKGIPNELDSLVNELAK